MLKKIKKNIEFLSRQYERRLVVPIQIQFATIETAIIEECFFEKNSYNFHSCIMFCHYDINGLVSGQVREICCFFQSLKIDVIFITTLLSEESRNWVKSNLSCLIIRKNVGRDFGAWKDAIAILTRKSLIDCCSQLYLVNDSLILMSNCLNKDRFIKEFINDDFTDVIGLTESWQPRYHLQSYFLKFNKNVIISDTFHLFWKNYSLINSREYSIINGEIGLSQLLLKSGYQLKAIYSISGLWRKENVDRLLKVVLNMKYPERNKVMQDIFNDFFDYSFNEINPSHRLWPLLLVDDCPVLKRDLIEKNPDELRSMRYFMGLIETQIDDVEAKKMVQNSLQYLRSKY